MKLLFWLNLALITYAYIGYAIWLWIQARLQNRPIHQRPILPTVSIIIAVRNEEANLPAKIDNIQHLDYPHNLLQLIIASDGSTDRTADILRQHTSFITAVLLDQSNGKAVALNEAVKHSTGDILVFQDARQLVQSDAISELLCCFADPEVGAVSGELILDADISSQSNNSLGVYWKIEKILRKLESASGSVVGVTGALYAMRRELYTIIPPETILDDVFLPMHVARMGRRVVFQPTAIAHDRLFKKEGKEFSRKVRTLTGNYQLPQLAPWLLTMDNPLLFRYISHKIIRLAVPLFLALMLISTAILPGTFYRDILWFQLLFYSFAIVGLVIPSAKYFMPVAIANTFVMLNVAAAYALFNFITRRNRVWI